MSGYAVAHTASCRAEDGTDAGADTATADAAMSRPRTAAFAGARERLARGALLFRVSEVVAMLEARASELKDDAERVARGRTALGLSTYCDEVHGASARAEDMELVVSQVRMLRDGDVPSARDLRFALSARSAAQAKLYSHESFRARASAEGAATVERYLVPRCITWSGPHATITGAELDLLSRAMVGERDVRAAPAPGVGAAAVPVQRVTRDEWRALLTADDAQRAPWEQPRGVIMFRPAEVAELLETEARLYEEAAEHLCRSRAQEGAGAALRHLAKDLRGEVWRVRDLPPGDVVAARQLLSFISRERRDRERARRRALWRRAVDHLEVMAELVEDLLVPLVIDGPAYQKDRGGGSEREVYRRWEAGHLDVRDSVEGEPAPGVAAR